jgi:GST-like protein
MIERLTADTPNGFKVSIALEETGLPYRYRHIKLAAGEQKQAWYLALDPNGRCLLMQWLMFQIGGVGPLMGQAHVFFRYAPEKIPYAIERCQREVRRLFGVLDCRLADHTYLADAYSIADIANWSWVQGDDWSGVSLEGLDHLKGLARSHRGASGGGARQGRAAQGRSRSR